MARIISSLDEYAVIVENIGNQVNRGAIDAMGQTRRRLDTSIRRVERRLNRLGRATGYGKRVGGTMRHSMETGNFGLSMIVRARGPWQIVDNSRSGGDTASHPIGPRPDANPRPLTPAKGKVPLPTMEFRSGGFSRKTETHPGSGRSPLWANAIQSVQPTIQKAFRDEWQQAIARAVG